VLACGATSSFAQAPGAASAGAWPARSVRIIVPSGPGGGLDIQGRTLSKKFYESTGQRFLIDNRPGAGTMLGTEIAAKSAPDGYTILFTTAALAVNVALTAKTAIAFDPIKDLTPVIWVSSTPLMLATHPSVPAKSVKDLVALAKARKGGMNASSTGSGTASHLTLEMFKQAAGVQFTHVPYNGGGPSTAAVISGEVDFTFTTILSVYPQVKAGRLRGLAVTTARRSSVAPELPAMAEFFPGVESDNWYALFAPAGTPKEIVERLRAETLKALKSPEVLEYLKKDGADPVGSTPEELGAMLRREVERYTKIVSRSNLKPE
jgi:tripartite-type tricarboxylate transporter receptor subunit TctC